MSATGEPFAELRESLIAALDQALARAARNGMRPQDLPDAAELNAAISDALDVEGAIARRRRT